MNVSKLRRKRVVLPTIAAVEAAGGGTAVEVESSDDRGDNDAEGDDSD